MILYWIILLPAIGGVAAWLAERENKGASRLVSLAAMAADLLLVLYIFFHYFHGTISTGGEAIKMDVYRDWVPAFGISLHLSLDGLSLLMLLLTLFLGTISVVASWTEIKERIGFFHLNLLLTLAGVTGVFLAADLFLFYFFWELMLVPMYFLIALWGHENRRYAAIKFFIFTQLSGLFMLVSILGLYFVHGGNTGTYTFDYLQLVGTKVAPALSFWLMLGFFIAFAVKLPVVILHTWLPDAHTEAPTAGSVVLAGLLLKTGAYGLIRFMVPLFPQSITDFYFAGSALAVAGILYGALMAYGQTDIKRLVAYSSVSHMGFVLMAVFTWNVLALQGAVVQMICHGLSTGGLFIVAGAIQERIHTRDISRMGGLWSSMPRMGSAGLVLALASLGLPGLGNFIGEFLVLLGAYSKNHLLAALAAVGVVAAAVYSLRLIQGVFHGEAGEGPPPPDASVREMAVLSVLIAALLGIGLYPGPVINTARPALMTIRADADAAKGLGLGPGAGAQNEMIDETRNVIQVKDRDGQH